MVDGLPKGFQGFQSPGIQRWQPWLSGTPAWSPKGPQLDLRSEWPTRVTALSRRQLTRHARGDFHPMPERELNGSMLLERGWVDTGLDARVHIAAVDR